LSSRSRANPECHSESLIYWVEVPSDVQHFLQGILDGCDGVGYYQTMVHGYGQREDGQTTALARITSTEDSRGAMEALLDTFVAGYGLQPLDKAPCILPDSQPPSRKAGRKMKLSGVDIFKGKEEAG